MMVQERVTWAMAQQRAAGAVDAVDGAGAGGVRTVGQKEAASAGSVAAPYLAPHQ